MENAWIASNPGITRDSDREKRNETIADKLRIDDKSLGFGSPARFNSQLPFLHEDLQALHLDTEAEFETKN